MQNFEEPFIIKNFNCNNNPLNVVPKFCSAVIEINEDICSVDDVISFFNNTILFSSSNVTFSISQNILTISSYGISSHAAHPDLGLNAISNLLKVLSELYLQFNCTLPILEYFSKYLSLDYYGQNIGVDFEDFSR